MFNADFDILIKHGVFSATDAVDICPQKQDNAYNLRTIVPENSQAVILETRGQISGALG